MTPEKSDFCLVKKHLKLEFLCNMALKFDHLSGNMEGPNVSH